MKRNQAGHEITVTGKPVSQKRHRHVNRGNFVSTYDPSSEEKKLFRFAVRQQFKGQPLTAPLSVSIDLYFVRPKSHYGTGRNQNVLKASAPDQKTSKGDIDNYIKFVFDALNDVVWADDAIIVEVTGSKQWGDENRTEITVSEIA